MSSTEVTVARDANGTFVQRARLDGARSQIAFALLLDTLARPGEIRSLARVQLPTGVPTPLVLPLALADVEVPVAVVSGDPDSPWPGLVRDATGAPMVELDRAAQIVLLDGFGPNHLLAARRGTNEEPDRGARLAIACRGLRPVPAEGRGGAQMTIELTGPGIDGSRRLGIDGLDTTIVEAIAEANQAYPAGIDCWFMSPLGDLAAIPRSSEITILPPTASNEETR
jgi:alpha-D-ribose 1-methylphosphonate 5-triphosphate synthase subunit PhnH